MYEIPNKKEHKKILAWANPLEIEHQAQQQLRNISTLPFIFKHIAVMPDVHLGKGATVGSVIATKGAIVPAAVGVDIGCFTGDTLIPILDGKEYPIRDLVNFEKDIVVYSCSSSGRVYVSKAEAKLTRRDQSIVKVVLDNKKEIKCTPDHKFMMRDGSYKEAKDLQVEDSLMPFYSEIDKDGYTVVQQNYSGFKQRAHWIVARSGLLGKVQSFPGERSVIHHKNFIKIDNNPNNLQFMSPSQHAKYHRSLVERNIYWNSPEFKVSRSKKISEWSKRPEINKLLAERGTRNITKFMKENREKYLLSVSNNGKRGKQYLVSYNTSEKGRLKSKEISNRYYPCSTCGEKVKSNIGLSNHKRYKHGYNHKVVSIEFLNEKEDVYCLVVPGLNNFALSAGVFVHNCGMAAIKTEFKASNLPESLKDLRSDIEWGVPVGFNEYKNPTVSAVDWSLYEVFDKVIPKKKHELVSKSKRQLGTLGGGNHFIEVCIDTEDTVWVMLHSGSRNIGKEVAEYFINEAKVLMKMNRISLEDPELAYLTESDKEFQEYWNALQWLQKYALKNREIMLEKVLRSLGKCLTKDHLYFEKNPPKLVINCHHNYAEKEVHFGEEVIVTRKGAVRAKNSDFGIIPGSMGTRSYIVKGRGNENSFCSCSHGAGRRLPRGEAKRTFSEKDAEEQTQGVECKKDLSIVDELPGAYKDIDKVMEDQKDLVEIVATLKQVLCVKG